jgi:hypothetical protein
MKTKVCKQCGEEKLLSEFPTCLNRGKKYYRTVCLVCHHKNKKDYYEKNKAEILKKDKEKYAQNPEVAFQQYLNYKRKYPWRLVWKSINERCYNSKTESYKRYGERGIQNFLTVEDVKFLYERDNARSMKKPTIDRKDNDGHYTLENCRFIEKSENSAKDKRKPVLQYDLDGKFIREFISVADANRYFGRTDSHIDAVANGKRNKTLGFIWKYKENV